MSAHGVSLFSEQVQKTDMFPVTLITVARAVSSGDDVSSMRSLTKIIRMMKRLLDKSMNF